MPIGINTSACSRYKDRSGGVEGSTRRHLSELVTDNLLYWLASKMRARARGREDFQNIVVPVNDLIGMRVFATGRYELTQLDAIKALIASPEELVGTAIDRGGAFIDVGANIGLYTVTLARSFSRTIAFEANPATFKVLEANIALSRVQGVGCFCQGVSDTATDGTIYVPEDGNLGWATLDPCQHEKRPAIKIAIRLDPLDDLSAALGLDEQPVSLVKIDVEGHEPQVLRGATRLLTRWGPIVLFEALDALAGAQCVEILRMRLFALLSISTISRVAGKRRKGRSFRAETRIVSPLRVD